MPSFGKGFVKPLQRLAKAFAELAETGNDAELEKALDMCLSFADTLGREPNIDETFAELPECGGTTSNPVRRLN
jgi:hypothetical protein